ncbi:MAG: nucleoside triphosphate pyrophosphohydrolase [Deltaproteobacteria bacterium]|nr:nucleoside triphosphate pyrophosphohydrolase [Deltaproteobacteria bacterium]
MLEPPLGPSKDSQAALNRLIKLIECLLDPVKGCPWDRVQTTKSITEDFLEEAYELRQALIEDSGPDILEEAGDLSFLVVFLSFLTTSSFGFGLTQILDAATDKMIIRHPHVFSSTEKPLDIKEFFKLWHSIKRAAKPKNGVLDSVPTALPALTRCHRLAQKAGRAGFDFPSAAEARLAISAELEELDQELQKISLSAETKIEDPLIKERVAHEIGDLLASICNLSRILGLSAEKALNSHNQRFISRFRFIEGVLAQKGLKPEEVSAQELERLWTEAKKAEKGSN